MTPAQREQILNSPALEPPEGVERNFVNPPSLQSYGLAIFQLLLATLVVVMRLYTKVSVVKKVLSEDYALFAAWILFVGAFKPFVFLLEELPLGVHQWNMTVRHLIKHAHHYHFATLGYCLVMIPLKTSLILQILRIFVPDHARRTPIYWLVRTFLWINILFYTSLVIYQLCACQPLAKAWDVTLEGHCTNLLLQHIISAAINTASDILLFVLPQPGIWRLNLHGSRKWGLRAVFLVGIFGCIAASIRLRYAVALYNSDDMTYHAALMGKWAEPELTSGFLAACLPILPSFIRHLRERRVIPRALDVFRSRSDLASTKLGCTAGSERAGKRGAVVTDVEFDELVLRKTEGGSARPSVGDQVLEEVKMSVDIVDAPKACSKGI